jgi:sirohydrochlorin ferrochelatase
MSMRNAIMLCMGAMIAGLAAAPAHAAPGLLLVAHGSPSPEWNRPVLEFGRRAGAEIVKRGRFLAARTALLESAQPDVPSAVAELEAAGCDRIVAVPLFIAPSGHTHFDVPAVLGLYSSPKTAATLAAEQAQAARPRVPIILTHTLSEGGLLEQYALAQVRALSKSPKDEALVILAHGDPDHQLLVDRLLRQVVTRCCGEAGIGYGDWAYIGVGQEYLSQGLPAIQAAAQKKPRVLVVGLYLASSAQRIHERSAARAHAVAHGGEAHGAPVHGLDVVFSGEPIVTHPDLAAWVEAAANAAIAPPASPAAQ